MPRKLNMEVGDVFGDLKVLRIWRPPEASSKTQCDAECLRCGSVKSYYASNLISGKTTSCGCKAVGKITKPCMICGRLFDSYRSDNRVTCSDACRRLRAAKSAHEKPRKWGEDAKRRRAESSDVKAQIADLQPRAVQAALAIPEGQRGLVIDHDKYRVYIDGRDAGLTQNEFKLVALLGRFAGRVLTYDYLIREIWGPNKTYDNQILRVNMANIRRKIEKNPAEPEYIFTEVGVGYRMIEGD